MSKTDFKKELKHLYAPSTRDFEMVKVPPMQFLMIDGHGDPNTSPAYQEALEALYAVAYKVKFASKLELDRDYTVPPLEGLWWAADMDTFALLRDKSAWDWTMMIMAPDWVTAALYERVLGEVARAKGLPGLDRMRLESYHEGLSAQIMHVGSYDDEGPTLLRLHQEWIPAHGFVEDGKHHEIYLSDPRRVAPDKLRTVLRQPVRPA